jgi:bifunctional pyridoxal-dependent enzyme with beta-cystathionase and maltose regulon repressor activities
MAMTVALPLMVQTAILGRFLQSKAPTLQVALPESQASLAALQVQLKDTQQLLASANAQLLDLNWAQVAAQAGQTFTAEGRRWWRMPSTSPEILSFRLPSSPTTFPAIALTPEPPSK